MHPQSCHRHSHQDHYKATMASLLHSALILSPLLLLLAHAQSGIILSKLESQSSINGLTVTLQCFAGSGVLGNRTFFRELNNEVERVTDGSENSILLTFELTPRLEGNYFCQVGNITSNRLELVCKSGIIMHACPGVGCGVQVLCR